MFARSWSGRCATLIVDAAPPGADRLYFAFVNYTTLGYGDVIPVERWRLLGPMTAMNGVLLFGWSTAVIFEVLRRTMRRSPSTGLPIDSPLSQSGSLTRPETGR
jgi:Ion channel